MRTECLKEERADDERKQDIMRRILLRQSGPVAVDREVVYSDMTDWRRFGRAPDFSDGRLRT